MIKAPLYATYAGNPHFNMAFDEWLLGRVLRREVRVAFRLYTWDRPTITFGINQQAETAVDFARLGDTPAIRRITGGRALLHDPSELTYCVVVGRDSGGAARGGWVSSATSLCREVALGLVRFLDEEGVEASLVQRSSRENAGRRFFHGAPCFASHARFEIEGSGGKLVASSARVVGDAALVHGAIKVGGVSSHPALPPVAGAHDIDSEQLKRIEETAFGLHRDTFRRTMEGVLDCAIEPTAIAECDLQQLLRREEFVRKNELARRSAFEQITL